MTDIDDAAVARARNKVAGLMSDTGVSLDDAALWAEPSLDLEGSIMAAISDEPQRLVTVTQLKRPGAVRWLAPLSAAAAAAIAFVVFTGSPSPDWTVALAATDAARGVTASVSGWTEDAGTRVELDIQGLDPAPEGFVYELWFSKDDVHISAGTFHTPGDMTLWAGVARGDFPRVWITLEPIDNDRSPATTILDTKA